MNDQTDKTQMQSSVEYMENELLRLKVENEFLKKQLGAQEIPALQSSGSPFYSGSSEDGLHSVFNALSDFYFVLDQNGAVTDVNELFCKTLGYSREEVLGKSSILSSEIRTKIYEEINLHICVRNQETTLRCKSGETLTVLLSGFLNIVQDTPYLYLSARNISDNKRLQSELFASEQKLRAIFGVYDVGLAITDETGGIVECNNTYEKMLGINKHELLGRHFASNEHHVVRPDLSPMPFNEFASVRALKENRGISDVQKGILHADGSITWLRVNAEPVNLPGYGVIISYTDITNLIDARESLQMNEHRYRTLAENITDVIWTLNLNQNRFTYISPSVYQLRGFTPEEAMAQTIQESLSPESVEIAMTSLQAGLPGFMENPETKGHQYNELQQTCKDGSYVWIETITQLQLTANGEVEVLGVSRNIENKKKAELALLESETRLKLSIEAANEGTWDWNVKTGEVQFNTKWAEMLGYELDELEKHFTTWVNRVHPEDFPGVQQTLYNHLNGETDLYKVEYRMRTKSGDWKWVEDVGKVVERDEKGKATRVIGLYYDISDLKNIQNQLQELNATKDKFFSIIAHDLKNPFSAILGFSRLIQDECSSDRYENIQEYNGYVLQSATTGYDLLVNLLDWARIQNGKFKYNPESLDLSALLSVQEVSFQASLTKKHQKFKFDVPEGFVVRADRFMFDTVLRNLISNAIKYTPEGGEITVRAERKDGVSEVRITDTGVGIPSDKMDKLFKIEEGYSTAGTNNEAGTGLGLILCKDFMKQQHGTIGVESVENHGTTFILTFPQ